MTQFVIPNADVWAISPRQLIDLDVSNFEFRISNICCFFYRPTQWKKNQSKYSKCDTPKSMSCRGH